MRDQTRRWASSVTLDEDDAEDLAQQVPLAVCARSGEFAAHGGVFRRVRAITVRAP